MSIEKEQLEKEIERINAIYELKCHELEQELAAKLTVANDERVELIKIATNNFLEGGIDNGEEHNIEEDRG